MQETKKAIDRYIESKIRDLVEREENEFHQSLLCNLLEKGNLSPCQVSYLDDIYYTLDEDLKKIFVKGIKVNLRKNKYKKQIVEKNDLKNGDIEFVKLCMSSVQRKRYRL